MVGGSLTDVIELRLPPRPEYLTLVRAAVSVISGGMSFNYDEIIQLRVAVSEAVQMATQWAIQEEIEATGAQLVVRFTVNPDRLTILLTVPEGLPRPITAEPDEEGLALLQSLVDEVEFGGGAGGELLVQMVKYKPAVEG